MDREQKRERNKNIAKGALVGAGLVGAGLLGVKVTKNLRAGKAVAKQVESSISNTNSVVKSAKSTKTTKPRDKVLRIGRKVKPPRVSNDKVKPKSLLDKGKNVVKSASDYVASKLGLKKGTPTTTDGTPKPSIIIRSKRTKKPKGKAVLLGKGAKAKPKTNPKSLRESYSLTKDNKIMVTKPDGDKELIADVPKGRASTKIKPTNNLERDNKRIVLRQQAKRRAERIDEATPGTKDEIKRLRSNNKNTRQTIANLQSDPNVGAIQRMNKTRSNKGQITKNNKKIRSNVDRRRQEVERLRNRGDYSRYDNLSYFGYRVPRVKDAGDLMDASKRLMKKGYKPADQMASAFLKTQGPRAQEAGVNYAIAANKEVRKAYKSNETRKRAKAFYANDKLQKPHLGDQGKAMKRKPVKGILLSMPSQRRAA